MAAGLQYGRIDTAVPGVYIVERFADLAGRTPQKGVLTLVGDFNYLKTNTVYSVTDDVGMRALAPGDAALDILADVVFNPSTDGAVTKPVEVRLITPRTTVQASSAIPTALGGTAVSMLANVWGPRGNLTRLTLSDDATTGGFEALITNGGLSERFKIPAASNVMSMSYTYPGTGTTGYGFGSTGAGSGIVYLGVQDDVAGFPTGRAVTVTFARTLPGSTITTILKATWVPEGPVNGPLTLDSTGLTLAGTSHTLTASIVGYDSEGAFSTEEIVILSTDVGHEVAAGTFTTDTSWTSVLRVVVSSNDSAAPTGNFGITGRVFQPFMADLGVANVAAAITTVADLGAYGGFTASTASPDTADIRIEDLDLLTPTTIAGATVSAEGWAIATAINTNSTLIAATHEAAPSSDPTGTYAFGGGSATTGVLTTNDWSGSFAELVWYNTNVVVPLTTSAAVHSLLKTHLATMWANGANERQGWVAAASSEAYSALKARVLALNCSEMSLVSQSGYIRTRQGALTLVDPTVVAANLAALQCGVKPGRTINDYPCRVVSTVQTWTRTQLSDVIKAGVTPLFAEPGAVPTVVRWVTTMVSTKDFTRTEGSARESAALSYRGLRLAVQAWKKAAGAIVNANVAGLKAVIEATLEGQSLGTDALIRGYTKGSIEVTAGAVSVIKYKYKPAVPPLFFVVEPTVEPEVAVVTVS